MQRFVISPPAGCGVRRTDAATDKTKGRYHARLPFVREQSGIVWSSPSFRWSQDTDLAGRPTPPVLLTSRLSLRSL